MRKLINLLKTSLIVILFYFISFIHVNGSEEIGPKFFPGPFTFDLLLMSDDVVEVTEEEVVFSFNQIGYDSNVFALVESNYTLFAGTAKTVKIGFPIIASKDSEIIDTNNFHLSVNSAFLTPTLESGQIINYGTKPQSIAFDDISDLLNPKDFSFSEHLQGYFYQFSYPSGMDKIKIKFPYNNSQKIIYNGFSDVTCKYNHFEGTINTWSDPFLFVTYSEVNLLQTGIIGVKSTLMSYNEFFNNYSDIDDLNAAKKFDVFLRSDSQKDGIAYYNLYDDYGSNRIYFLEYEVPLTANVNYLSFTYYMTGKGNKYNNPSRYTFTFHTSPMVQWHRVQNFSLKVITPSSYPYVLDSEFEYVESPGFYQYQLSEVNEQKPITIIISKTATIPTFSVFGIVMLIFYILVGLIIGLVFLIAYKKSHRLVRRKL